MKQAFRKNVQVFHLLSFPNGKSFECNVWRGGSTSSADYFYVGCVTMNGKEEQYYMNKDEAGEQYVFADAQIPDQLKAIEGRINKEIQDFEVGKGRGHGHNKGRHY